jgi:hypothetical protein
MGEQEAIKRQVLSIDRKTQLSEKCNTILSGQFLVD